ncbi:MAG: C45 family autoproteolytic acyltransferase/hydrolase [Planctomycetota bacterium]
MKLIRYPRNILSRQRRRPKANLALMAGVFLWHKNARNYLLLITCLISYLLIGCATSLPQSVQGWKLIKDDKGATTFGNGSLTRLPAHRSIGKGDDYAKASSGEDNFFILHLSGTPYEMGYQQGVLLKEDISKFTDDSWEYIDTDYLNGYLFFVKWFAHYKARSIAKEYIPYIPQEYIDEMRGIADGSGIAFNNVLLANAFIETAAQIGKRFLCTSLVLNGPNTFDSSLVHAYNTDTYLPLKGRNYIDRYKGITFYHPEKGNSFVTVTSCGFNSVFTGMNDKGIAVSFVCPMKSAVEYGMPVRYLIRRILEKADNLAEAQGMVKSAQRTIEGDITISDGQNNQAATIVFSPPQPPDKITWTEKIEEIKNHRIIIGRGENEIDTIIKHHDKKEQFDIKDISKILRYEPWDNHGICSSETSFSTIYHPSSLRFWVALGDTPTPANTYYGFDIKGSRLTEDNPLFPSIIPPLPREPQIKEFIDSISFKPVTITLGTALTQTLLITPKNPFDKPITVDIFIEPVNSSVISGTSSGKQSRRGGWTFPETYKQIMLEPGKNQEVSLLVFFDGQNPFPIPETMIECSIGGEKMFRHYDNLPYALESKVLHIKKSASNINIDGKLDEENWRKTEPTKKWINTNGTDWALKDTDWSVCYDNDFLYLSFNCQENEMDKIKQTITTRDWETLADDSIVFYIDPTRDGKSYFCFGVTAFGVTMDYKASLRIPNAHRGLESIGQVKRNRSWNPDWNIKIQRGEKGYIVEAAIPFKSLECKSPLTGTEWRINAFRMRTPTKPELSGWNPPVKELSNPAGFSKAVFE